MTAVTRAGTPSRVITSCGGICWVTILRLTLTNRSMRDQQDDAWAPLIKQTTEPEDDPSLVFTQDPCGGGGDQRDDRVIGGYESAISVSNGVCYLISTPRTTRTPTGDRRISGDVPGDVDLLRSPARSGRGASSGSTCGRRQPPAGAPALELRGPALP